MKAVDNVLKDAILNGLYNKNENKGNEFISPQLVNNDDQSKIWFTLRQELMSCTSFTWAVAFISENMLVPFKLVMSELAKKGVNGTLITGTYLGFNSPKVFKELVKIPNLEVRLSEEAGFHAKGYIFNHEDYQTILIGSANFTRSALLKNCEWGLKVTSHENGQLVAEVNDQIENNLSNSLILTSSWIKEYEQNWQPVKKAAYLPLGKAKKILPNQMQKAALANLNALVKEQAKKALVVSATGTGKTYLGAFAVKEYKPKKFLYLVHREQIAKKALESFYRVIGGKKSDYGLLTGNKHDFDKKYLFGTVQTVSQEQILEQLDPEEFDYILIDEAHRVAAPTYQKILNHFAPKFLLGMTATPERMDKQNIYEIFDYHLAYEIRLKDALNDQMLTPFHYVGVEDYTVGNHVISETSKLKDLVARKRVEYVLKQLDYYGYCGEKAKGLVFCSRQEEARELAKLFSQTGHPSRALTNEDSQKQRIEVTHQLENGELEYIFTVDLFNEGIDIPSLNQIVMLRNTQSSIVFIQQLGRGLRKFPGKDYVTVIDFLGNYKNNYLIPIALNGDKSRDKDQAVRESKLPQVIDVSTINFTEIASQRILVSLEKIKLDSMRELRQSYKDLKEKIGRVPLLYDFYQYGTTAPTVFAKNHALAHYGDFLKKMGEEVNLGNYQNAALSFVTKELLFGKRPHELLLLESCLDKNISRADFTKLLKSKNCYISEDVLNSVEKILSLNFFDVKQGKTTKKEQYGSYPLIEKENGEYRLSSQLLQALNDNHQFKMLFEDVLKTGLALAREYNSQAQFTLYKQYDRKDVCRLLNWPKDVSAPMYGYRVGEKETPIFITYQKDSEKKRNARYQNTLENGHSLRWYTRTPRHLDSDEVKRLLHNKNMKLHLFVKRSDAAGKEFYYLGTAEIQKDSVKEEKIGLKQKCAVGMNLVLNHPLKQSIYNLLFS
ncbi:superfamily II DNA/RNA helicase [Lactobacillus gasseri]|uniref:DNA repair helicase RadD n=1 Tax=Lactobacillus gasseri TaxID=1596 RepID=A0ABY3BGI2_LACGS|nr:putative DNA repair helicase RadD [Lactobacillus gasseri]STX21080.1 superfamily II DNA/RNA helicase [Lactobacillus gasseri]